MKSASYLENLAGLTIRNVQTEIDHTIPIATAKEKGDDVFSAYIQLYFDGYILNIYNTFEIIPDGGMDLKKLIGLKTISANETKEEAELLLDNGKVIKINLRDEAYTGPEAMFLKGPDELFVVWN